MNSSVRTPSEGKSSPRIFVEEGGGKRVTIQLFESTSFVVIAGICHEPKDPNLEGRGVDRKSVNNEEVREMICCQGGDSERRYCTVEESVRNPGADSTNSFSKWKFEQVRKRVNQGEVLQLWPEATKEFNEEFIVDADVTVLVVDLQSGEIGPQ
ncbi:hypothetical protein PM082_023693 [Marasmius tenuissimus]|nr:hypothetical protein PM082_023693 [Marasmius tenuissimus]